MAIDFPNSPSAGDSFTANSKTWTFTGGKWVLNVSTVGVVGPTGPTGVTGATGSAGPTGQRHKKLFHLRQIGRAHV